MSLRSIYIVLIAVTLLKVDAFSQVNDRNFVISISPFIGIPVTDIKSMYKIEIGASFAYERIITDDARIIMQYSLGKFNGKSYTTEYGSPDDYPPLILQKLRVGGKYFFADNGLFVSGLVGAAHNSTVAEKAYGYSLAPGIGYEMVTMLAAGVSYEYSKFGPVTVGTVTFNLAYQL